LRYQLPSVIKALEEMASTTNDPKTRSPFFSNKWLNSYAFVLSLVIWYEILSEVNVVSKSLQCINIFLELSTNMLNGLLTCFEQYRTTGFDSAKIITNTISMDLEIEIGF